MILRLSEFIILAFFQAIRIKMKRIRLEPARVPFVLGSVHWLDIDGADVEVASRLHADSLAGNSK